MHILNSSIEVLVVTCFAVSWHIEFNEVNAPAEKIRSHPASLAIRVMKCVLGSMIYAEKHLTMKKGTIPEGLMSVARDGGGDTRVILVPEALARVALRKFNEEVEGYYKSCDFLGYSSINSWPTFYTKPWTSEIPSECVQNLPYPDLYAILSNWLAKYKRTTRFLSLAHAVHWISSSITLPGTWEIWSCIRSQ